jgi:hypothetical protein
MLGFGLGMMKSGHRGGTALNPTYALNYIMRVDNNMGWWDRRSKDGRLFRWLSVSIIAGFLWGIWQGGILQGFIYGLMLFVALMVFEWCQQRKNK